MNSWNIYFSAVVLSFLGSILLATYVFSRNTRNALNRIFSLNCVFLALWTFVDFSVNIAKDPELQAFWVKAGFFWPMYFAVLLHFCLIFTEINKKPLFRVFMYATYILAIMFSLAEFVFIFQPGGKLERLIWTWCYILPDYSVFYRVEDVWVGLVLAGTVVIQTVSYFLLKDPEKRTKARFIFVGYLISIVSSSGLFGLSVLFAHNLRSLVPFATLIGHAVIAFGIWKHELFVFDAAMAAENTISTMTDALFIADMRLSIMKVNGAASALTGYAPEELTGLPFNSLLADETSHERLTDLLLSEGKIIALDGVLANKSGTMLSVSLSASVLRNRKGERVGAVIIIRDITEEKQRDEQLAHFQKLEAIGQLAGGIAHDFNNTLAAIILSAQEVIDRYGVENSELSDLIDIIAGAAYYGRDLTRKLLAFARKERSKNETIDIHTVIIRVITLLSHTIDKRITIKSDLRAAPSDIFCQPLDIQSAILNIALNSCDAMEDQGGELFFRTYTRELDKEMRAFQANPKKPELYVTIEICDNGMGMDEFVKKRMFDPFFTTKPVGKGTGLGLSSVYGTIQRHNGLIDVKSASGVGTMFIVHLPLCPENSGHAENGE